MNAWKEIRQVISVDGQRRMRVNLTPNNLFRFFEETWVIDEEEGEYWSPSHMSGVYASAEEAERAARLELPWLRDQN
jgi:hypothetical protein